MDWILQQDANKKAGRRRKKPAQTATGSGKATGAAYTAAAGGGGSADAQASTDPVVAAAALQAFGGVVDLCCTAGCRRQRLLSHFGETLPAKQPQGQLQQPRQVQSVRCCDYCDSAANVEAAVQQLQQFEQQMIQRRFNSGGFGNGGKKRKGGAGDMYGYGDYSDEEDGIESASSGGC